MLGVTASAAALSAQPESATESPSSTPAPASRALTQCLSGYRHQRTDDDAAQEYVPTPAGITVTPEIAQWLNRHNWRNGYTFWRKAAECQYLADIAAASNFCTTIPESRIRAPACTDKQTSLDHLTTHRYLLQTMRAVWPYANETFTGWKKFPKLEDFPESIQDRLHAWPDAVARSAMLADGLHMMPHAELLSRWPSESDFAHWLLCGTNQPGMGADAVYGALLTNGLSVDTSGPTADLEDYLFWQAHGWLERVWNKYRMRIGKMPHEPELQAAVLRQCQSFQYWVEASVGRNIPDQNIDSRRPLYTNGYLNPDRAGQNVRIMGEVLALESGKNGLQWLQVDVKRIGVKPVWVYSPTPLANATIGLGGRYTMIGSAQPTTRLGAGLTALVATEVPTVLILESIQTLK